MIWWIVEDALRDKTGHWLEYTRVFRKGLEELGDEVRVLADRDADADVLEMTGAEAVLPNSIWHRMNDKSGLLRRSSWVISHAWATCLAMASELSRSKIAPDIIYVPTVLCHHLLAWWLMLRTGRIPDQSKLLLYFVSTPVSRDPKTGVARISGGPTAHLLRCLLRLLAKDISNGRVVLGVETQELRDAISEATGVSVTYLPQPVEKLNIRIGRRDSAPSRLLMGCYGPARHEKGSDLLQRAISHYLREHPDSNVDFVIQWLEPFKDETGVEVRPDPELESNPRMKFIRHYISPNEYADWLGRTDVMLLPYRRSSYDLRGSRVALEAMVEGIPIIITKQTAAAKQAGHDGGVLFCEDEDVCDLANAMVIAAENIDDLKRKAAAHADKVVEHYSIREFRRLLLDSGQKQSGETETGSYPDA